MSGRPRTNPLQDVRISAHFSYEKTHGFLRRQENPGLNLKITAQTIRGLGIRWTAVSCTRFLDGVDGALSAPDDDEAPPASLVGQGATPRRSE